MKLNQITEKSHLIYTYAEGGWAVSFKEVVPYNDSLSDKGLPDSFFDGRHINIEYYPDKKLVDWTGNVGIVFTKTVTGEETVQEIGNLLAAWCETNIG